MTCGRDTPETALQPFQGWLARKVGGLRPFSTLLDTPRHMPMKMLGLGSKYLLSSSFRIFTILLILMREENHKDISSAPFFYVHDAAMTFMAPL
jgi:hypothetical protein